MLTIPSTLALIRLMLAETSSPHGLDAGLSTAGYFVGGFLARRVTLPLRRPRVLLTEQQAQSLLRVLSNCSRRFARHTLCATISAALFHLSASLNSSPTRIMAALSEPM
jgi:hypothetical protein